MKEQLISFDTAKLAKEKGCQKSLLFGKGFEYKVGKDIFWTNTEKGVSGTEITTPVIVCTQSLLQKWLRDVHNKDVLIEPGYYYVVYNIYKYKKAHGFNSGIGHDDLHISDGEFESYEEALEKGLQEALKLIK